MEDLDALDFLAGQRDCRDGIPHQMGRSESYDRGYAVQYEHDEVRSQMTISKVNKNGLSNLNFG